MRNGRRCLPAVLEYRTLSLATASHISYPFSFAVPNFIQASIAIANAALICNRPRVNGVYDRIPIAICREVTRFHVGRWLITRLSKRRYLRNVKYIGEPVHSHCRNVQEWPERAHSPIQRRAARVRLDLGLGPLLQRGSAKRRLGPGRCDGFRTFRVGKRAPGSGDLSSVAASSGDFPAISMKFSVGRIDDVALYAEGGMVGVCQGVVMMSGAM